MRRGWSSRTWGLVAGLAILGLPVAGMLASRAVHRLGLRPSASRTTSPYRNTRPGVKYVGDASCASCHEEISAAYHRHSMGRSMAPAADAPLPGLDERRGRLEFSARGLEYAIERRDGRIIHSEVRKDAAGKVIAKVEAPVTYAVGSGHRGRSYLIERDGFLVQSPISWYTQEGRWDLSPDSLARNNHFERPIDSSCVFCHANLFEPRAGTINAYEPPTFRGLSIGCERCHGPGELHLKNPGLGADGIDSTIVNPAKLEPVLRESVCAQCHLAGRARVERFGRTAMDYRPGLLLGEFLTVFVERKPPDGQYKSVGHVEQMHASRCFRSSEGRMGCISCHDAHRLPTADERVSYYRQKCLDCHGSGSSCRLPEPARRERSRDDSCIECHMPRSSLTNVAHTAETDHAIPRWGEASRMPSVLPQRRAPERVPIVAADVALFGTAEEKTLDRELGIALAGYAADLDTDRARVARLALEKVDDRLKVRPDDLPVLLARVISLTLRGQSREAQAAADAALAAAPNDERTLALVLPYVAGENRLDDAIALGQRLVAISPRVSKYSVLLAKLLAQKGRWQEAGEAARKALEVNPLDLTARHILVRSAFESGDRARGRIEAETYLKFDLDEGERQAVRKWIEAAR